MEVSGKRAEQIPSTSILQGSDNDAQFYCIPCEQEGHCVQAHGYCQNCAEYLCETCYISHRKPAPCRNHVLLDSSKMPKSQKYQRSHPVAHDLVEPCPKHQGEIIKYYCHDHDFFGCSPCITINHRTCKADYIPDVSENFVASQEYTNLLHSLKTLCNSCKEIAVTTKENKREIKKRTKDLREKIVKFRQDINHTLDKWEMELNQQVEHFFGKESSKAESVETECTEASTEVQKMQNDIETLHKSSKLNELFIKVKKNEHNLKNYAELIDQMQEKNTVSDVTFEPNLAIERMLLEDTSLGKLILQQDGGSKCLSTTKKEQPYKNLKKPAMERKQQKDLDRQEGGQNTNTKKVSDKEAVSQKQQTIITEVKGQENSGADVYANITATQSCNINIKAERESKNCYITGIAIISRDKLAIADNGNRSIKIVDTKQSRILSNMILKSSPWDVILLPADELAVTIPGISIIQVLSESDQLSTKRQIKVKGHCHGLSYFNQNFVVTFSRPTKVEILTVQGDLLMTLMEDQSFQMPDHVAVDVSKNLIYVSDVLHSSQRIACLSLNGEVTCIYEDSKLNSPRGLAVLEDGSLLVTSSSSKICLVSPDFKTSRVVQKTDGLNMPESVALDREQKKLYVGSWNDNFLWIYKLKW